MAVSFQPVAMHPFFQSVHDIANGLPTQSEQDNTPNSDSSLERPTNNSLCVIESRIGLHNASHKISPLVRLSNSRKNSKQGRKSTLQDTSDNAMHADLAIDPNLDRRKRRKASDSVSEFEAYQEPERSAIHSNIDEGRHNCRIREELARSLDYASRDERPSHASEEGVPTTTVANFHQILQPGNTQMSERMDARFHHSIAQKAECEAGSQTHIPFNPKIPTPKKKQTKTLSTHSNGKLLSSPSVNEVAPGRLKAENDPKPMSRRNYKVKNGKFLPTLELALKYGKDEDNRKAYGTRISAILENHPNPSQTNAVDAQSKTHPFFLGKHKVQLNVQPSLRSDKITHESNSSSQQNEPIAWKDIKFSTQRVVPFKSSLYVQPIWPPSSLQHVGYFNVNRTDSVANSSMKGKSKKEDVQLAYNESILDIFTSTLSKSWVSEEAILAPRMKHLSGITVATSLDNFVDTSHRHDAITAARSILVSGLSAFDRGECAGPNMWTQQFAPTCCAEVLQPSASALHQWLQGLAIHNVQSGRVTNGNSRKSKSVTKKKQRKMKDDLDDFVVWSDDEDEDTSTSKNAILITGPHGCGKTSSVFAVAKELGYEVFEIHPGMRRSAKDIFDKVGDMAHNHLVHNTPDLSRSSSIAPSDNEPPEAEKDRPQSKMSGFLGTHAAKKSQLAIPPSSQRAKKEQKQSLILFEEVDLIFEDDKGFWSGVQSLIANTKRPVVLTCNDMSSIPVEDLNLFDILQYKSVEDTLAVDYLLNIAAAEGHILEQKSVSDLYRSKGRDLRASMTELNLWCQMTVGSQQGGLDWMVQKYSKTTMAGTNTDRLRVFSHNTFRQSIDLMPPSAIDIQAAVNFHHSASGIVPATWCDCAAAAVQYGTSEHANNMHLLGQMSILTDARSAMDLWDGNAASVLAAVSSQLCQSSTLVSDCDKVMAEFELVHSNECHPRDRLSEAMEPLMNEKPTFPPSQGRLAPSLDTVSTSLATEIAPYVRCIVDYDRRLEQYRDEISGSQGTARKTRASRAAAEGGDKASTRYERWFPKGLDFNKVLSTGSRLNAWMSEGLDVVSTASVVSSPDELH